MCACKRVGMEYVYGYGWMWYGVCMWCMHSMVAEESGWGLVIKTTGLCKDVNRGIGTDVCPMSGLERLHIVLCVVEDRANGCCIPDSTKVAKFLDT